MTGCDICAALPDTPDRGTHSMSEIEKLRETLGLIRDHAQNVLAASTLPLPASIHVEG